jgi:hypothetical protein
MQAGGLLAGAIAEGLRGCATLGAEKRLDRRGGVSVGRVGRSFRREVLSTPEKTSLARRAIVYVPVPWMLRFYCIMQQYGIICWQAKRELYHIPYSLS